MIEKRLASLMPETPTTQFDFSGVYVDAAGVSHNVVVFDTNYFYLNAITLWPARRVMVTEENSAQFFLQLFNAWKNSRKDLYFKQAYAYTLKYNPIENYSSVEQMIDDITEHEKGSSSKTEYHNSDTTTITPYTKETVETTPYTKETTEVHPYTKETTEVYPYTKETTETIPYTKETAETIPYTSEKTTTTPHDATTTNSVSAFDSQGWANSTKSVESGYTDVELTKTGTEKTELTKTGTEKVEFSKTGTEKTEFSKTGTEKTEFSKTGTEKVERSYTGTEEHDLAHTGYTETTGDGTDTDTRNYTLTKKGNIGVMTPSEMLQKEYEGLMQDLAYRAMSEFIDRYTYYCEEVF